MEPWGIFLWILPTHNHPKLPFTEKKRNKAKYITWTHRRLTFLRKTSMPNSVESLGYIKFYISSSLRTAKSSSISIRNNCQRACSWSRYFSNIFLIQEPSMGPSNNLENKTFSGKYWRVQPVFMNVQANSSLEPPLKYD